MITPFGLPVDPDVNRTFAIVSGYATQVPPLFTSQNGAALRLGDVAKISDGVEDRYNSGFFNNDSAVLLVINRQSGANIIETVDRIKELLPRVRAATSCSKRCRRASTSSVKNR